MAGARRGAVAERTPACLRVIVPSNSVVARARANVSVAGVLRGTKITRWPSPLVVANHVLARAKPSALCFRNACLARQAGATLGAVAAELHGR